MVKTDTSLGETPDGDATAFQHAPGATVQQACERVGTHRSAVIWRMKRSTAADIACRSPSPDWMELQRAPRATQA